MKQVYAPGCAFMIYKPELAKKVLEFLNNDLGDIPEHSICCRHEPNYNGMEMTIHDACPTRTEERVHSAIRKLLKRMNIKVIEPKNTRANANCCGDSFYGILPAEKVKEQMKKRSNEMPCDNVVVYCVSCIKAIYIGDKKPRYIVDLLFGEETEIGTFEPNAWHDELQKFIDEH